MYKLIGVVLLVFVVAVVVDTLPSPYPVRSLELLFIGQNKEYYISTAPADLDSARRTCSQFRQAGPPLSLLAIEDDKEYTKVVWYLMRVENVKGVWTSGYYSASNDTYTWTSTKKEITYMNFGSTIYGHSSTSLVVAPKAEARQRRAPIPAASSKCALECLVSLARGRGRRSPKSIAVVSPKSGKARKCGLPYCEEEPCEPLELRPCETITPNCTVTCTPKCTTVRPPCSVKCEPCEIYTPPCVVSEIECDVQADNCTTDRPPCEVYTPPCETIRPPCKTEQPNCIVTTPPPCTVPTTTKLPCLEPVICEDTQPPCIVKLGPCENDPEEKCGTTTCPPPTTTCKPNPTCAPAVFCQSPAIICPAPITTCPPPETKCPPPEVRCPKPETSCPEPVHNCKNATYYCPPPVIKCPSPVISCPNPVTVCDQPEIDCPKPIIDCPTITPVCPPPKKCTFGPPCTTTPIPSTSTVPTTTSTTLAPTTTPCSCAMQAQSDAPSDDGDDEDNEVGFLRHVPAPAPEAARPPSGWILLHSKYNFKWDVEPSAKKAYHFICEGSA